MSRIEWDAALVRGAAKGLQLAAGASLVLVLAGCARTSPATALQLSGPVSERSIHVTAAGAWSSVDLTNHDAQVVVLRSVRFLGLKNARVGDVLVTTPGSEAGVGIAPEPLIGPLAGQVHSGVSIGGFVLRPRTVRHELVFRLVPRDPHKRASTSGVEVTYDEGGQQRSETSSAAVCLGETETDSCGYF